MFLQKSIEMQRTATWDAGEIDWRSFVVWSEDKMRYENTSFIKYHNALRWDYLDGNMEENIIRSLKFRQQHKKV